VALRTEWRQPPHPRFRPLLLCAVFAATTFAFFSASGSKLPGYILPVYPPLALLAAAAWPAITARHWARQLLLLGAGALLLLALSPLIGRTGAAGAAGAALRDYGIWISAACAVLLAAAGLGLALARRGRLPSSLQAWSLGVLAASSLGLLGHETLGRPASGADLVPAIERVLRPDMPIYAVRLLDHTLPFYLRRTTVMVEDPDELDFGTRQEPLRWLPTLAAFEQAWTSGRPALAVMRPETAVELQSRGLPLHPVARDERRVVVANFAPAVSLPASTP
jgi:4-amino-4-deoxy-L-arabinose transferase-like glycosyltransferase